MELLEFLGLICTLYTGHTIFTDIRVINAVKNELKERGYVIDWRRIKEVYLTFEKLKDKNNPMRNWFIASLKKDKDFLWVYDQLTLSLNQTYHILKPQDKEKIMVSSSGIMDDLCDALIRLSIVNKINQPNYNNGMNVADLYNIQNLDVSNIEIQTSTADIEVLSCDERNELVVVHNYQDDSEFEESIDVKAGNDTLRISQKYGHGKKVEKIIFGLCKDDEFTSIKLSSVSGNVDALNLKTGRLNISTFSGNILCKDDDVPARIYSITGDIHFESESRTYRTIDATSYRGQVISFVADDASNVVYQKGGNKKITATSIAGNIVSSYY